MKHLRYLCFSLLVLVAILMGATFYMLDYSLARDREAWDEKCAWERIEDKYPWTQQWVDSIRQEGVLRDTFIFSADGRALHAYYLPCAEDSLPSRTALLVHGYKNCAVDMMHLGYMYHEKLGCNILLPDLHAHGQSEGENIRMGWLDRLDVLLWAHVADSLFHAPIVVHGISMGAATTMMLSGEEDLPESITHFVEDCGYTSVWDEFQGELKAQFSLPAFPLMHLASATCEMMYGWNFTEASALEQVKKCTRPMLFIHGDADTFVPTWMVHPLYEAHPGPKDIWLPEGVTHALSYYKYPTEYTERVRQFLYH